MPRTEVSGSQIKDSSVALSAADSPTGTADIVGVLPVTNGGTGVTTLTGLVKGNGASGFTEAVAGTDYVTTNGTEVLTNKTLAAPLVSGSTAVPAVVQASGTDPNIELRLLSKDTRAGEVPGEVRVGGNVELHANGWPVAKFIRESGSDNWLEFWSENGNPGLYAYRSGVNPVAFGFGCSSGNYSFGNFTANGNVTIRSNFGGNRNLNLVSTGTGTVQANSIPVVTTTGAQTVTNKTLALGSNTISGTLAQFNTAVTDADLVSLAGSETLTNKTLTSPNVSGSTAVPAVVQASGTDTNVGLHVKAKNDGHVEIHDNGWPVAKFIREPGSDNWLEFWSESGNPGLYAYRSGVAPVSFIFGCSSGNFAFGNFNANGDTQIKTGHDGNRNLNLATVGTGTVQANGIPVVTTTGAQSLSNKTLLSPTLDTPLVSGSAATPAAVTVSGTDTNIGLDFKAKGTSAVRFMSGSTPTVTFSPDPGAPGPLEFYSEVTRASVEATGGNRSLNLVSSGTGTVRANNVPVVTTTGVQTLTSKTLTSPRVNQILDTSGAAALVVAATASAVNYAEITNAAAGGGVTVKASGGDTNITLKLQGKGTAPFVIAAGNTNNMLSIYPPAGAVNNYLNIQTAGTGVTPSFGAIGSDTNVSLNLTTQGTGTVQANGVPVVTTTGVQSLSNKTLLSPTITGTPFIQRDVSTVTSTTTLGSSSATDYLVLVGAGGAPTLPTAVGNTNRYTVKNTDTTNKTVLTTASQTIDGLATLVVKTGEAFDLVSDGANWRIV